MELHYKIYGSGDPVVILHGLFGMSDNWKTLARKLSDTYSVVLIDLPNHGRSPRLPVFEIPAVAEALHEFLTSHWMYQIRLIGHSLGGKVAMKYTLHYPDMVEKLVSIDIGPQAYEPGHQEVFRALMNVDVDDISTRAEAEAQMSEFIDDIGVKQFLLKNLKRKETGFEWKFDLHTLYRDYFHISKEIKEDQPFEQATLFIRGDLSSYLDYEQDAAKIYRYFPSAELHTIKNSGHWVHADQPDALEEKLRLFLQ